MRGNLELRVCVERGVNLKVGDLDGESDPYVVCSLNGHEAFRTTVKKRTVNPIWHETKTLLLKGGESELICSVFDWDEVGTDDNLGEARVDLTAIPLNKEEPTPFILALTPKGQLVIYVSLIDVAVVEEELAKEKAACPKFTEAEAAVFVKKLRDPHVKARAYVEMFREGGRDSLGSWRCVRMDLDGNVLRFTKISSIDSAHEAIHLSAESHIESGAKGVLIIPSPGQAGVLVNLWSDKLNEALDFRLQDVVGMYLKNDPVAREKRLRVERRRREIAPVCQRAGVSDELERFLCENDDLPDTNPLQELTIAHLMGFGCNKNDAKHLIKQLKDAAGSSAPPGAVSPRIVQLSPRK